MEVGREEKGREENHHPHTNSETSVDLIQPNSTTELT